MNIEATTYARIVAPVRRAIPLSVRVEVAGRGYCVSIRRDRPWPWEGAFAEVITPGAGGFATLDVLRRRWPLVVRLPRGRAFVAGRMPL